MKTYILLTFWFYLMMGNPLNEALNVSTTKKSHSVCLGNAASFCDSTWLSYPNLNAALFGIDKPSLNPVPNDFISEPGMRNQIFQATWRDDSGAMAQYDYVQTIDDLRCATKFDEYIYSSFEDLINGWGLMEESGYGIRLGFETKLKVKGGGVSASASIPPLFSRSQSKSHEAEEMEKHFNFEKGSVAHSRAECSIYRVLIDISNPQLTFYTGFSTALLKLDEAARDRDSTLYDQNRVGMQFVEKYGTHYAKSTQMGSAIAFETRYSGAETMDIEADKRKDCSTKTGARVFGFQTEKDKETCTDNLSDTTKGKDTDVKRTIMKTVGSFPAGAGSISDWSKQLQEMAKEGKQISRYTLHELFGVLIKTFIIM